MRYRDFKGTKISEIGFGSSGFWGDRRFSETKAIRLVSEAFDLGINHFDTGHNYCNYNAEPRLGRALAQLLARYDRSQFIISTKAGTVRRKFLGAKHGATDFSPDYIEGACAKSLSNLGVDFVDIFYLHGIPADLITDSLLGRLQRMKERGMFRFLGVNTHREQVMKHIAALPGIFDVALVDFNAAQQDRLDAIEMLHGAGISVMAGNVLAQGHLISGKIGRLRSTADIFYLMRAVMKSDGRRLARISRSLRPLLAGVSGMSAPQAAMAFALSVPQIASCVFGTTNSKNLAEIADSSSKQINQQDLVAIQSKYTKLAAAA